MRLPCSVLPLLIMLCFAPFIQAQDEQSKSSAGYYICRPEGIGPLTLNISDGGQGRFVEMSWWFSLIRATYTQEDDTIRIHHSPNPEHPNGETLFVLRANERNGFDWEKGGHINDETHEWFKRYEWTVINSDNSRTPALREFERARNAAQRSRFLTDKEAPSANLPQAFMDVSVRLYWQHYHDMPKLLSYPNHSPTLLRHVYASARTKPERVGDDYTRVPLLPYIAAHPNTPADILQELINEPNAPEVWRAVAQNPATKGMYMDAYLEHIPTAKPWVRERIARDPLTPREALELAIAQDEAGALRAISNNPNAPAEILLQLIDNPHMARDLDGLAFNRSTPIPVLEIIAERPLSGIHNSLLKNPSLPDEIAVRVLRRMATQERAYHRRNIPLDKRLPVDLMLTLSTDHNTDIRRSLTYNEELPLEILQVLCNDPRRSVAGLAREKMQRRFPDAYKEQKDGWTPLDELNRNDHLNQDFTDAVRAGNSALALQLLDITTDQDTTVDQQTRIKAPLENNFFLFADIVADAIDSNPEPGKNYFFYDKNLQPDSLLWAIEKGYLEEKSLKYISQSMTERGRSDLLRTLAKHRKLDPRKLQGHNKALIEAIRLTVTQPTSDSGPELIKFWIQNGADPYATDEYEESPISIAMRLYSIDLIKILDTKDRYKDWIDGIEKEYPATTGSPFCGIWSNRKNEFGAGALLLRPDGSGMMFASVAGLPLLWKHLSPTQIEITAIEQRGDARTEHIMLFSTEDDAGKAELSFQNPDQNQPQETRTYWKQESSSNEISDRQQR